MKYIYIYMLDNKYVCETKWLLAMFFLMVSHCRHCVAARSELLAIPMKSISAALRSHDGSDALFYFFTDGLMSFGS